MYQGYLEPVKTHLPNAVVFVKRKEHHFLNEKSTTWAFQKFHC
jgi:hypothetical protein